MQGSNEGGVHMFFPDLFRGSKGARCFAGAGKWGSVDDHFFNVSISLWDIASRGPRMDSSTTLS